LFDQTRSTRSMLDVFNNFYLEMIQDLGDNSKTGILR